MFSEIEQKRHEIQRLCRKYNVRKLVVFGSAAQGDFDPEHSDIDFLVIFDERPCVAYANAYFGLWEDLERLFQRPIDLMTESGLTNPFLRKEVEKSQQAVLYAA